MLNPGSNNAVGTESCVRLRGKKINDADCFQESKAGISGLCHSHYGLEQAYTDDGIGRSTKIMILKQIFHDGPIGPSTSRTGLNDGP